MRSLSGVGLGLSLVFGCLLLALIAELYYLLWWKKRITNREIEDDYSNPAREFLYMFCWKKPSSLSSTALNPQELCSSVRIRNSSHIHEQAEQAHQSNNKDCWLKPFGEEDGVESELMMLQNLSGPPRFLFTIKEETKEDLESEEEGKSKKAGSKSRSLSDLILTIETPFLTPLASPPYFTPPLTPRDFSSHSQHGFNPLFESSSYAEFNRIRSSPPPKFKFLRDAEDKLYKKRLIMEEEDDDKGFEKNIDDESNSKASSSSSTSMFLKDEESCSFITLIVAKNKEREVLNHHHNLSQYHSSSSQVLPLASSPSTFTPLAS